MAETAERGVIAASSARNDVVHPVAPLLDVEPGKARTQMCLLYGILFVTAVDEGTKPFLMNYIASDLNALYLLAWFVVVYSIALTTASCAGVGLKTIYSQRAVLLFGNCFYIAGNIGSAFSRIIPTSQRYAIYFGFQWLWGTGFGLQNPVMMGLVTDLSSTRKYLCCGERKTEEEVESESTKKRWRPIHRAIWTFAYGSGKALGVLVGGGFKSSIGWNWEYWILAMIVFCPAVAINFLASELPSDLGQKQRGQLNDLKAARNPDNKSWKRNGDVSMLPNRLGGFGDSGAWPSGAHLRNCHGQ